MQEEGEEEPEEEENAEAMPDEEVEDNPVYITEASAKIPVEGWVKSF